MKTTTIELDKPRTLRYDLNALCAIEETTGKPLAEAVSSNTFSAMRVIIWAGLKHEDPALTVEAVGAMVDPALMNVALAALVEALPNNSGPENPPAPPLA
jgi:hypothetical protein